LFELKALIERFVHQLYFVIQGSIHTYLAVAERVPKDKKLAAWDEYNENFDRQIMPQLLEVLERNNCGVAELCHATLKLMEIGARMVETLDKKDAKDVRCVEEEALKSWFVPVH